VGGQSGVAATGSLVYAGCGQSRPSLPLAEEILLAGGGCRVGSWSHHGLRERVLVTPERLARASFARPHAVPHRWLNVRSALAAVRSRGRLSTTQRSPKTKAIVMHTLAPLVRTTISCRGFCSGRPDRKSTATNRIQAGRARPAQSIVSISSVLELSRYGARHVGRLGSADLDSSGLSILTTRKVSVDQECGHSCGRCCGRPHCATASGLR